MAIIEVDFTGVTSGAGFLEPGVYRAQVESVEQRDGKNYPGLSWTWSSVEPDTQGQRADLFTSLSPKALWVLKGILEAFGAEIPQSAMRFETNKLVGKQAMIKVINEPWTDAAGEEHPSSKVERVFKPLSTSQPPNGNGKAKAASEPLPAEPDGLDFGDDEDIPF
jgi:hypothetical protein